MNNDNVLYIGTYGNVVAINQENGVEIWRQSLPNCGYYPVNVFKEDNCLYCSCHGVVFILNCNDGKIMAQNDMVGLMYGYITFTTKSSGKSKKSNKNLIDPKQVKPHPYDPSIQQPEFIMLGENDDINQNNKNNIKNQQIDLPPQQPINQLPNQNQPFVILPFPQQQIPQQFQVISSEMLNDPSQNLPPIQRIPQQPIQQIQPSFPPQFYQIPPPFYHLPIQQQPIQQIQPFFPPQIQPQSPLQQQQFQPILLQQQSFQQIQPSFPQFQPLQHQFYPLPIQQQIQPQSQPHIQQKPPVLSQQEILQQFSLTESLKQKQIEEDEKLALSLHNQLNQEINNNINQNINNQQFNQFNNNHIQNNNHNNNNINNKNIPNNPKKKGDILEKYNKPHNLSLDDLLFVGIDTHVVALNKYTAEDVWRCYLGRFMGPLSLVYSNDQLMVGVYGHLFCIDPMDGHIIWKNDLPGLRYYSVSILSSN